MFEELEFGNTKQVDLHGLSKEEARATLVAEIYGLDACYTGIIVIHGYHLGQVLRNFVRCEFEHPKVTKIVKVDASRTFIQVDTKSI